MTDRRSGHLLFYMVACHTPLSSEETQSVQEQTSEQALHTLHHVNIAKLSMKEICYGWSPGCLWVLGVWDTTAGAYIPNKRGRAQRSTFHALFPHQISFKN